MEYCTIYTNIYNLSSEHIAAGKLVKKSQQLVVIYLMMNIKSMVRAKKSYKFCSIFTQF